ncbi:MAG: PEP-CTERM sorting domain-containing protein [Komarekiella atlantica HA4396-MV6]|jgi:hypothetical protein|nr:PEP-CTERM sorting domain-containing protein [Komarekiella atlantica HA4396-MV6]
MKNRTKLAFVTGATVALGSVIGINIKSASAVTLTWTLNNVIFNDGGQALGSFNYDANTNILSNWNISVSGGNESTFPPLTYTPNNSETNIFDNVYLFGLNDDSLRQIRFEPISNLTNAGGTIPFNPASIFASECYNCSPFRAFASGSLTAQAVPEPLTILGVSTAIGFGSYFKRELSKKQKREKAKA